MLGKGIAMAALMLSATWLEVNGLKSSGLWVLAVIWILVAEWNDNKE